MKPDEIRTQLDQAYDKLLAIRANLSGSARQLPDGHPIREAWHSACTGMRQIGAVRASLN